MMSAKAAARALLKKKYFEINVITSYILPMTSPTKLYHITQIILWILQYEQSLVNLALV